MTRNPQIDELLEIIARHERAIDGLAKMAICPVPGNVVPNAVVLMFVRGWQGGTIHQIADDLGVTVQDINGASPVRMEELMRLAQRRQRETAPKDIAHPNHHGGAVNAQGRGLKSDGWPR